MILRKHFLAASVIACTLTAACAKILIVGAPSTAAHAEVASSSWSESAFVDGIDGGTESWPGTTAVPAADAPASEPAGTGSVIDAPVTQVINEAALVIPPGLLTPGQPLSVWRTAPDGVNYAGVRADDSPAYPQDAGAAVIPLDVDPTGDELHGTCLRGEARQSVGRSRRVLDRLDRLSGSHIAARPLSLRAAQCVRLGLVTHRELSRDDHRLARFVFRVAEPDGSAAINEAALEYGGRQITSWALTAVGIVAASVVGMLLLGPQCAVALVFFGGATGRAIRAGIKRRAIRAYVAAAPAR